MLCYENIRLRQIEKRIKRIKQQLLEIDGTRPGTLTRQYNKDRKEKKGAYFQLSYTYKMKSRTDCVRPENVDRIKEEIKK